MQFRSLLNLFVLLAAVVLQGSFLVRAESAEGAKAAATPAGQSQPVLVELFTSEGCSSCPPADALLEKMDEQPLPGEQLIVMSEHVTYWDHDGWKDPNSSSALTDRQDAYEGALGVRELYTPQMIVDGTRVVHISDREQARTIFENEKTVAKIPIRIEDVSVDGGNPPVVRARVEADANLEKHGADVYAAVALNHVESQVLHGENGGRRLVHVAVVQQLTKVGKLQKGKSFDQVVQFRLKAGEDARKMRLIVFIQESGQGKVLGAAVRKQLGGME